MIHFDCDYMAGAHPEVLDAIVKNNLVQTAGYGSDNFCARAKDLIREACGTPEAAVHFMVGGTQTNSTVLDGILGRIDGVIAAETGHINVHESGAVELFGHKVIALPSHDGKLCPAEVRDYLHDFYADDTNEHMVAPGAVYISFPSELGTLYSLGELEQLNAVCHEYDIPLYIDGARLGHGLAASPDVTLPDIARLADVFYIGGTKMGALMGEAVVCTHPHLMRHFFTLMKAHGAVLAKGRLLGLQFWGLFRDGLYERVSEHAIGLSNQIRSTLVEMGVPFLVETPTNQLFPIFTDEQLETLEEDFAFSNWERVDEAHSAVRICTSWATPEESVDALIKAIQAL